MNGNFVRKLLGDLFLLARREEEGQVCGCDGVKRYIHKTYFTKIFEANTRPKYVFK